MSEFHLQSNSKLSFSIKMANISNGEHLNLCYETCMVPVFGRHRLTPIKWSGHEYIIAI